MAVYAKKLSKQDIVLPDVHYAKGAKERARFGQELNILRKSFLFFFFFYTF